MDTKLKKTHKVLKVVIILLTVLIPSVVMFGFQPRLERLTNEKLNELNNPEEIYMVRPGFIGNVADFMSNVYSESQVNNESMTHDDFITNNRRVGEGYSNIIHSNIAYMYDVDGGQKDFYAGNLTDEVFGNTELEMMAYKILYENLVLSNEEMELIEIAGYYIVEYDEYGCLVQNTLYSYDINIHDLNFESYSYTDGINPSNSKGVFFLTYENEYVYDSVAGYNCSEEQAYFEVGTPVIIVTAGIIVMLVALLLPFFRQLNTGNEKIFRMPGEIVICLAGATILGMIGMFYLGCFTNINILRDNFSGEEVLLGFTITPEIIYNALRLLMIPAWSILLFCEYVVVSAFRQLITHPIVYIKERFIIIRIVRKMYTRVKNKIKGLINKGKELVSTLDTNKRLVIVLLVNLVVAAIACACWLVGIPLFMIYTVVAYILVYKKYMQTKVQYEIIKESVHKMAEGDFDIHIDEDLGVFQPITDELVKVKDGFEKALIEEAKSRDMKTELITNVSHDLKTPLTAIITYVDLLKKEDITEEERKQYVATLDMKSQRLKVLIEDLFEVSKANSGNVSMNIMDVDVAGLLKQVRLELEDKINESNIEFRWNLPNEKVLLKLDGQKTYRIFSNLINNITKYSLNGSRAFVDVYDNEEVVIITFKNISATEINCNVDNLTERFVRGDASRNSEGSGLGLAIVKSFVELQGGNFKIDVDGDLFKAVIEWSK